jgi:hypothetical protein
MPTNKRKKAAVKVIQPVVVQARPEKRAEVVVPSDLLRSAPRPVRFTFGGWAVAFVVTTLLLAAIVSAVWLPRVTEREQTRRHQFQREAVRSEGEILKLGPRKGEEGRREITWRYTASGSEYVGRATLSRREWRQLKVGDRVPIRYQRSDPSVSYFGRRAPDGLPWPIAPLTVISLLAGATAIGIGLYRQRRLVVEGRPALATVISSKRSQHGTNVQVEFKALSGAVVKTVYEQKGTPQAATRIVLLYDRDNPRRVTRYPGPLVRVARWD